LLKVGIIFGGPSREREISFAGGRTVYDNLNKSLFEAVPLFVDSHRNFILLDWQYVYKGTIRDFYPPMSALPDSPNQFQVYLESLKDLTPDARDAMMRQVGRPVALAELADLVDVAFLALHGNFGEDGQIQGLLETLNIPYTGSGIRASSIGMDKAFQKKIMSAAGFPCPHIMEIKKDEWTRGVVSNFYKNVIEKTDFPIVIRPATQGSSIGVAIIDEREGEAGFLAAVDAAFFRLRISSNEWTNYSEEEKIQYLRRLGDIREGIGFPVNVYAKSVLPPAPSKGGDKEDVAPSKGGDKEDVAPSKGGDREDIAPSKGGDTNVKIPHKEKDTTASSFSQSEKSPPLEGGRGEESTLYKTYYHPENLLTFLNDYFTKNNTTLTLESHLTEQVVIAEEFIDGQEFSCIVLRQEDGTATALPPTEIIKGKEVFDYRSKYLAGLSRKETPIRLPDAQINEIRSECERLFGYLEFNTYARIDGFIKANGTIYLNDPNTTSGMLPSSFFFHQAAEIGLNPSQFLTYIIRASLQERMNTALEMSNLQHLIQQLDESINSLKSNTIEKKKIAVILGGYSSERHISVESGRNIYEKLASSDKYEPIPIFLTGNAETIELYQIPINLLLKDNADDIRDKIYTYKKHPVVEQIKTECHQLTQKYASSNVVFEPRKISYEELKNMVDATFIALHGRPGEDGTLQRVFDSIGLPYNGSPPDSAATTINKYKTLQKLKAEGFTVTEQLLVAKTDFTENADATVDEIEAKFNYPLIAKPLDDGCSSAVKMIKTREEMTAYLRGIFRNKNEEFVSQKDSTILKLLPKEEFPHKEVALIEALITRGTAKHFLEVTGGLLTKHTNGKAEYEIFEPSEALSEGEILSLEEKFLAGEGQNITPARFADNQEDYAYIAAQVKADLRRAAKILNVQGYARIDAFVRVYEDNKAETIIIEVNSLPGMTPATCIFHQTAINGYKPYDFIDKILEYGLNGERQTADGI